MKIFTMRIREMGCIIAKHWERQILDETIAELMAVLDADTRPAGKGDMG